jgi:hypothetical protein
MMTFALCSCDEESQGLFEDLSVDYSEEVVGKLWGSFSDGWNCVQCVIIIVLLC